MRSHSRNLLLLVLTFGILTSSYGQYVWLPKLQVGGLFGDAEGIYSISFNPLNHQTIYAGSSGSLYVSYDAGENWESLWDTTLSDIRFIAVDPVDSLVMYVGRSYDLWRTTNGGADWQNILDTIWFDGESIAIDPTSPNKLYASGYQGGFHRSTDYGNTWSLSPGTDTLEYCTIALRPDSTNILYTGSGGGSISKSTDYGFTWRLVHTSGSYETPKIVIDPQNPVVAYACHLGGVGGVWKTINGGETWFASGLDSINLWSLDIDKNNPSILFTGEFYGEGRMFRTTDAGQTWTEDLYSFPQSADHWMVKIVPVDTSLAFAAINVYCGDFCNQGAIYKFQRGNTMGLSPNKMIFPAAPPGDTASSWLQVHNGPGTTHVDSVRGIQYQYVFAPDTATYPPFAHDSIQVSIIYPSTSGVDTIFIWSRDITDSPKRLVVYVYVVVGISESRELPTKHDLWQNYPNPFNSSTVISFQLPVSSVVTMKVYNVLGQEIATLANGEMKPGSYEVTWDASDMPSGVYFYRLQAGLFTDTKKLLLLR